MCMWTLLGYNNINMTRNNNHSRISGKWRVMTKECHDCDFKSKKGDRIVCNFGGILNYISTKTNRIYSRCTLKSGSNKN